MTKMRVTTLGNEIDLLTGFPFPSESYSSGEEDIKLLRGDNIGQGNLRWNDAKKFPVGQRQEYEGFELQINDVVLAMDRPWIDAGLKYASLSEQDLPCLLVQRTARMRGKESLNTIYLKYIIGSPWFTEYIKRITTGSLVPHISSRQIKEFPLQLPSISEQKRIAAVLSAIDQKIEINKRINTELEAMAKTLYDYWFVQFDFPDENGKPYKSSGGKMVYNAELKREIPAGWSDGSLWGIAKYHNGLAMQKYRPKGEKFLPVIKIKEMGEGFSDATERASPDLPKTAIVEDGDVLFSWSATLDVKIWSGGTAALNQHIFKVASGVYPKSFFYYEILNYLNHFKMMAEKRKTTMGHITLDHLKQSRIVLPPIGLIQSLDKKLTPIFKQHLTLEKENQRLAALREYKRPMLMNRQVWVESAGRSDG